jgi:hypothetical protein
MTTRFMIIRKSDKTTESGVMPKGTLPAATDQYNEGGPNLDTTQHSIELQPSSKGARVIFSGGKSTVIDGPFTESKGLVAGFAMIDAKSKEEAVECAKRWSALGDDGEVELREAGCPGGVAGVSKPPGGSGPSSGSKSADLAQFAILLKATEHTEAGFVADEKVLTAMTRRNEEAARAGVLLAGEGLKPSSRGARVKVSKGKAVVMDGPFAEAKELVAGFWLIQVKSRDEAIEWVKRYPYPLGPDGEGEVEIREVFEAS